MVIALKSSTMKMVTTNFSSCQKHNTNSVAQYCDYDFGLEVMLRYFVNTSIGGRCMQMTTLFTLAPELSLNFITPVFKI
jgi:hypothetical protein